MEGGVGEGGGVGDACGGVVEESVVRDAEAGEDDHLDLDVAALYGSGDDVAGGEGEAEERADGGVEGEAQAALGDGCGDEAGSG